MVVVQVRDQHRVDVGGEASVERRRLAAQVSDSPAQERIGEQADPVQLDQDAGMPQENDTVR
jgi:hypothetical protein